MRTQDLYVGAFPIPRFIKNNLIRGGGGCVCGGGWLWFFFLYGGGGWMPVCSVKESKIVVHGLI